MTVIVHEKQPPDSLVDAVLWLLEWAFHDPQRTSYRPELVKLMARVRADYTMYLPGEPAATEPGIREKLRQLKPLIKCLNSRKELGRFVDEPKVRELIAAVERLIGEEG